MRYWYDFEFLEDGQIIDPISVGVVAEDGREYYAVYEEVSWHTDSVETLHSRICQSDWLVENVVPHLPLRPASAYFKPVRLRSKSDPHSKNTFDLDMDSVLVKPKRLIRAELLEFLLESYDGTGPYPAHVELWAYYAAYDHVCLAQHWGPMAKMPNGLPRHTNDIKQEMDRRGITREQLPPQTDEHNALADARWNHAAWEWITEA